MSTEGIALFILLNLGVDGGSWVFLCIGLLVCAPFIRRTLIWDHAPRLLLGGFYGLDHSAFLCDGNALANCQCYPNCLKVNSPGKKKEGERGSMQKKNEGWRTGSFTETFAAATWSVSPAVRRIWKSTLIR